LDDYIDLEAKERELMKMWNRFMGCSSATVADKEIPSKVCGFLTMHGMKLKQYAWEIYQMMITFWEHRLLSSEMVEELMLKFHSIIGTT
jgi:VEFS-Box of polycomb protein